MTDELVEKIARAIQFPHVDDREALRLWKHASLLGSLEEQFLHSQARACLSVIEAAGMVIVPKRCLIPLTNGGHTMVSEEDVDRVTGAGNWFSVRKGKDRYVCRSFGAGDRTYLHRWLTDATGKVQVDHINGDTLDNRRGNLRVATFSENNRNRAGAQKNSKSGVRGVHWHKQRGRWAASIRHEGKKIDLGLFDSIADAKLARTAAEERLWSPLDRYRQLAAAPKPPTPSAKPR